MGAGPAGLSAAVNLHQRGKQVCLLGHAPSLLGKAEQVDNYLGMPALSGPEMMDRFTAHAASLSIPVRPGKVVNILPLGDTFMLNVSAELITARSVIRCSGIYRAAPLPGEEEYLGRGVSYCATCDGMLYRQKKVVVWGQSASAPEEADFLASLGCNVTYVAAKEPAGTHSFAFLPGRLTAVEGGDTVQRVLLKDQALPCDGVFILREGIAPTQLVPGIETEKNHIKANRDMSTNIPGLFAAGDCTGEPYQVAKAVGEGLVAALSAAAYLDAAK